MSDYKVDWSRIVWDIANTGLHVSQIARKLRVSRSTVIRWRDYNREPLWAAANRLLNYWATLTGGNPDHPPKLIDRR